ncbi:YadA-like family protein [Burkholderia metallica]|uniref:YadA-like family protein n=1 Tax=Burkholderia metallica TaxID=488729 RepID=A0ABT8PIW5_9BURK|nr:ESPR-type extended signal peptide-containing protein [Burkholderia metallica]MDN7935022.1 YadA-like family protein [Burkholderia metallica]
MNKTYRNIWNTATGTWTAVAETARSRSKGSARAARQAVAVLALGSASIGGAFAADACTTEDGVSGSVDAAGVCKVTASRMIGTDAMGTDAIGTTATLTDNYFKVNGASPNLAAATGANAVAIGQAVTSSGSSSVAIGSGTSADGLHSMALGASSSVVGDSNLAVGDGATVSTVTTTPTNAIAIGKGARVTDGGVSNATGSIAIGTSAAATGTGAIMIGTNTRHVGDRATVVGTNASATGGGGGVAMGASSTAAGSASVAMGPNATATGLGSIAIGNQAITTFSNSVAIGNGTTATEVNSTVIGSNAKATDKNTTALGQSAQATGLSAVGIGFRATAQGEYSVALGTDSAADRDYTVSVGSARQQRQIVNVAAGTQATDAVNVSQLTPVVTALGGGATIDPTTGAVTGPTYALTNGGAQTTVGGALGALDGALTTANGNIARNTGDITTINTKLDGLSNGTIGLVQQSAAGTDLTVGASTDGAAVNFTGTAGARKLTGVNAGIVSATSKDAVNGSQLHGVSDSVASAIGGGSVVNTDGSISAPSFTLGDGSGGTTTVRSVGGAVANLDGRVTTNEGDIASLADQIGNGTVGLVQQAGAGADITVGASTDGAAVNFTGTAGARKLTGVDAGAVTASSTDAVNGSQLYGVSDSVASAIGGGSVVNTDGTISAPSFTLGDGSGGTTTVRSVGGAVTNLDGRVTTNEGAIASLADQIGNGTVGLVQQAGAGANITVGASTDGAAVDFTGTAGARKLTGVDAGAVTASSTDAVNGSQLHGVSDSVASAIGGGSVVNADGSISAPSFTVGDGSGGTTTVTSVGGAITNLDGRVTTNEGDIASLADQIGNGTVGLVQQAGAGANITVGANTDGAAVDFTGTAGARKLTGVDAGAVTASSTDAVNGSQLHGVSDSVASAIGGGSVVNPDGSISAPSFTVGDGSGGTTTVHSVGDAVTNLDGRVTTNEGAVASLADQIGSGTLGLVQQAGPGANLTVGANTDGTAVSFVGTAGARKLSGVANGVNDDDAVTIAQLKATGLIDYTGKEIAAVTYDDISLASVTFGGSAGTKLLNVAPGLIASGSMEAVNGGQLYDLQERFAQEYARLDGRVGDLEAGGGSGGGGGGGGGNVGPGTGGEGSLVVGDGSAASGENSSAIGQGSNASGSGSTAVGQGSNASGGNSSAIGQGAVASGDSSTAIGQGSKATGSGSVAIGAGSVADRDNSVSVGTAGHERQITNVADGTAPTDAVNVRQMEQRFGETNRMINDVAKNAYAGVAAAMAMPNLTPSQPGKTVVAAGAANYKSGSAIAAGATYRTRDGKWLMNGAVSVTSTGDAGVRAQVGYEF